MNLNICPECSGYKDKRALRCSKCNRAFMVGEHSANYRGGIYLNNPREYKRLKENQRRAKGVTYVRKEDWEEVLNKYCHKCVMCGEKEKLTIDHILPISKGGKHKKENLMPLCKSCNCKKKDRLLVKSYDWFSHSITWKLVRVPFANLFLDKPLVHES
jgi:5-methylcytosine-specific restriction endonuclease McrA